MSTVGFFVILAMMFFATRSLLSKDSVITKAAMVMVAAGGVTLVLTSAAFGFPTAGIGPWIGFALIAARYVDCAAHLTGISKRKKGRQLPAL